MIDTLPFMKGKRIRIHYSEVDGMIDLVEIINNDEGVLSQANRAQILAAPLELSTILFKYSGVRPEGVAFDYAERTKADAIEPIDPEIKKDKKAKK